MREIPFSFIQFPLWEAGKTFLAERQNTTVNDLPTWQVSGLGSLSGGFAAVGGSYFPLCVLSSPSAFRFLCEEYPDADRCACICVAGCHHTPRRGQNPPNAGCRRENVRLSFTCLLTIRKCAIAWRVTCVDTPSMSISGLLKGVAHTHIFAGTAPTRYTGMVQTLRRVFAEEGFGALMSGVQPRVMWCVRGPIMSNVPLAAMACVLDVTPVACWVGFPSVDLFFSGGMNSPENCSCRTHDTGTEPHHPPLPLQAELCASLGHECRL